MSGQRHLSRCMFWYTVITVIVVFLYDGLQDSIIAPTFPIQSKVVHNSGETFIGLTMASNEVGNLIASLLVFHFFSSIAPKKYHFIVLCSISGACVISFGISDGIQNKYVYQFLQVFLRATSGVAVGFNYCFAVVFLSLISETQKMRAILITTVSTVFYTGISIAPLLAIILIEPLGYTNILLIIGGLALVTAGFLVFAPSVEMETQTENSKQSQVIKPFLILKRKRILIQMYCQLVTYIVWGFVEASLALFLFLGFGANQITVGYVFSVGTAITLLSSLASIYINSKELHKLNFATSIFIQNLAMTLLSFSAYHKWFSGVVWGYCLHSFARSMTSGASVLYMNDLIENEIENASSSSIGISSSVSNILTLSGRSIGLFFFGGLLFDHIGYFITVITVLCLLVIAALGQAYILLFPNQIKDDKRSKYESLG